jgi:protein-S-isoprenylcysteine O-methyltransferase Ste14
VRVNEGAKPAWWKGQRGEAYVAVQFVLMLLVLVGPRTIAGLPEWTPPFPEARSVAGAVFVLGGGAFFLWSLFRLGSALTPIPYPKDNASIVVTGPFSWVRHPIYSGALVGSIGIAMLVSGWLTWIYAALLFALFDVKSRREERWLREKYPEYESYQRRVRRLVPFVY